VQDVLEGLVMDEGMLDSWDADVLVVPVPGWQSAGKHYCKEQDKELI
jgi:hypothetical protein